jgi:hypothetical protein
MSSHRHPGIKRGEVNDIAGFFGFPGCGKTTLATWLMMQRAEAGFYVFAVDPNENLPERLPSVPPFKGARVPLRRFGTVAEAHAAMQSNARGIIAIDAPVEEVIAYAMWLVRARMTTTPRGQYGPPALVYLDELVTWKEGRGGNHARPVLDDLLARRRPHHVAFWYASQWARQAYDVLIGQSTHLYLFYQDQKKDLDRLSDGAVPDETLAKLDGLAVGEHETLRRKL